MSYACLLPVYNEATRVGRVLDAVSAVKAIDEVIVIDGGSTDGSAEIVENDYPQVHLIKNPMREGKAKAILDGLAIAKDKTIIMLDSDMVGLQASELSGAIDLYEEQALDCLILSKAPANTYDAFQRKLFGGLLLSMAGERIVKKSVLESAMGGTRPEGYQLEIAQNKYLIENNLKVRCIHISAKNTGKVQKHGWLRGVLKEMGMWRQVAGYAGVGFMLRQARYFKGLVVK